MALRPFGELAAVGGLHDGTAGFRHVVQDAGEAGDAAEDSVPWTWNRSAMSTKDFLN